MHSEKGKNMQLQGPTGDSGGGESDVMVFMNVVRRVNTFEA